MIWKKTIHLNGISNVSSGITESADHQLFICGTAVRDAVNDDILLIKTDANGDTIWTKTYGGPKRDYGKNIITGSDGHILISSQTSGEGFGTDRYSNLYLLKLNIDGDTLWTKTYKEIGEEVPSHLLETKDKGYLLTCSHSEEVGLPYLYFLKVGPNGDIVWKKSNAGQLSGTTSMELSDGALLTCGGNVNNEQAMLLKMDKEGNILWQKTYYKDYNAYWYGESIVENQDHSYTMTGPYYLFTTYIFILKVDTEGNLLFADKFTENARESGDKILKDNNDDNLIIGHNRVNQIFMTRVGVDGKFK
jgi:hypothetical protein